MCSNATPPSCRASCRSAIIDEDEIAFAEAATAELAEAALQLPPAIAPLERRLLLAELIAQWAKRRAAPARKARR